MAQDFDVTKDGDYQQTNTYRDSDRDTRRQLNRYKKECGISDEHMFLMLTKNDLLNVSEEQRSNADFSSKAILVVGVLIFWNSMMAAANSRQGFDLFLWGIALVSFGLVIGVYFSGVLNPYKRATRKVNKYLRQMPEAPSFEEWRAQQGKR